MTLDDVTLARLFHKTYELLAPTFGYETRPETREFDPESPNGRLMIAVCATLRAAIEQYAAEQVAKVRVTQESIDGLRSMLEGMEASEKVRAEIAGRYARGDAEPVAYRYSVQPQALGPSVWCLSETNDTGDAQPLYTRP